MHPVGVRLSKFLFFGLGKPLFYGLVVLAWLDKYAE